MFSCEFFHLFIRVNELETDDFRRQSGGRGKMQMLKTWTCSNHVTQANKGDTSVGKKKRCLFNKTWKVELSMFSTGRRTGNGR